VIRLASNICLYYGGRPMPVVQTSLFELGETIGPRPLPESLPRTFLSHGAWVDVVQDWMAGSTDLFEYLLGTIPWQSERRRMYDRIVDVPRLVAYYGEGERLPDQVLEKARDTLSDVYGSEGGAPFCTTGFCLYRSGSDSVAWHGDTIGRRSGDDTLVAIVSLGEPRRFLLRPKAGGAALRFTLGHGDLLVMGGSCQRTWEHAVPKTARPVGQRISVQFRSVGVR
jgi:alkylated DNA repair dioxygenase AlkB